MSNANQNVSTKVVTGKVRFSYANLFKARSNGEGQDPKFSVSLIISKDDKETLNKISKAVEAAKQAGLSLWGGKAPANLKLPLRDGDEDRPDQPEYANSYFINASSKQRPGIVDKNLQSILDETEVYSGCYGRASINFYAFNKAGNRGIGCGLQNIQKVADGESLGGTKAAAEDDFDAYDDDLLD